ncbi:glycosyltransferase [Acidisphaera sp. L21]|uniref:glycosyltransferase n=1 Tax=Acidisphaera sp. L21 TaxID=1641851 RepID=UPI00131E5014|nr:glycosyltransferase [Acidisphaera sp. L21]
MKVAIIHEWLETFAGSERVVAELLECFPDADVFVLVDFMPEEARGFLKGRRVRTSFIQKLPFARSRFRHYLGLMPIAVEQFDLSLYDLVISSSHAVAKGVITGPDQVHVSYVHSPMRWAWDMQGQYLRQTGMERGLKSIYLRWLLHRMRLWDVRTAHGVDVFVANSRYVARRIRKVYGRDAIVVPPPVDVDRFTLSLAHGDAYLVASRMAPYKRIDLVVEAFTHMPDRQLVVIGDGSERASVVAAANKAPNITFLGAVSTGDLVQAMGQARAFIFPAEEDFGITMVEAQACGTPVIAFGRGGALDIVLRDGGEPTGYVFDEQTPQAIVAAVAEFERIEATISPENCRRNAVRFSRQMFRTRMMAVIDGALHPGEPQRRAA